MSREPEEEGVDHSKVPLQSNCLALDVQYWQTLYPSSLVCHNIFFLNLEAFFGELRKSTDNVFMIETHGSSPIERGASENEDLNQ